MVGGGLGDGGGANRGGLGWVQACNARWVEADQARAGDSRNGTRVAADLGHVGLALDLLGRAACVFPICQAADIGHVGITHVFEGLASQRRLAARATH